MLEDSSDESVATKIVVIQRNKEPDWKNIYLSVNVCLFKSNSGKPMCFHVAINDHSLKKKYEELICSFGGRSIKGYNDMNDRTALLLENSSRMSYRKRPSFKLSYLIDCVMADSLLNINDYIHGKYTVSRKDFMKILYWETGVFGKEIVERYENSSDECDKSQFSHSSRVAINHKKLDKRTREPYTRNEKEAILNFIISKQKLDGLSGDSIWKLMERKGICPRRTYQSMKNHFLKKMVFELDNFEFLSETEKNKLRKET